MRLSNRFFANEHPKTIDEPLRIVYNVRKLNLSTIKLMIFRLRHRFSVDQNDNDDDTNATKDTK